MNTLEYVAGASDWLHGQARFSVALVIFAALLVTAATSKNLLAFLAAAVLAAGGFMVSTVSDPARYVALTFGAVSLLISIAAIQSRRRITKLHHKIDRLKRMVEELEHERSCRLMRTITGGATQEPRITETVIQPHDAPPLASTEASPIQNAASTE